MKRKLRAAKFMLTLSKKDQSRLADIQKQAETLMAEHSLHHYKFRFNRRKVMAGICSENIISLNLHYCLYAPNEIWKNTLLHEIAHALVGVKHGHREIWQNKARALGVIWMKKYHK